MVGPLRKQQILFVCLEGKASSKLAEKFSYYLKQLKLEHEFEVDYMTRRENPTFVPRQHGYSGQKLADADHVVLAWGNFTGLEDPLSKGAVGHHFDKLGERNPNARSSTSEKRINWEKDLLARILKHA